MRETVQSEHASVCGVGLGTVGASTAEFFLGRGIPTYGCDLDPIALGRLSPRLTGRANALSTFGVLRWAVPPSVLIPAPEGPNGRTGPGTLLMASHLFGRPSKSPSQTSDSTRTSGVVSRPCHSLASLKYSFRAPVRYGPMAGRTLVGGFRHVIQSKGGTLLSVPTRWTVENGGRETMNLGTNAMSWGGVRPGGSDENRSG